MGKKAFYAICAINVLASGFAVAWVTKPYWQAKPQLTLESPSISTPPPAKTAAECWTEFIAAPTHDAAFHAIAAMGDAVERQDRLKGYLRDHLRYESALTDSPAHTAPGSSLACSARHATALAVWGETVEAGSEDWIWLQSVALDRNRSALERETALKAVVLAAQRRHKAASEENHVPAAPWREQLAAYLLTNDFGRGASTQGLALQAMVFVLAEKITPLDRAEVIDRAGRLLLPQNGAAEPVVLAAFEVAQQLGAAELLGPARAVARRPLSDACAQAALYFLAAHGTAEDAAWLDQHAPASAALQIAAGKARHALLLRLGTSTANAAADIGHP